MIRSLARGTLVALSLLAGLAHAQTYPSGPIHLIVPYPPGGGADGIARNISDELAKTLKVPVVVDNRPGASSTIGINAVAKARPDGYTIGLVNMAFTANPGLIKDMPYDTLNDLAPVGMVAKIPLVVAVHPSVKADTLQEYLDLSKQSKEGLFYGSAGNGTSNHLIAERLKKLTGANLIHVPYRGGAPSVVGLAGNEVSMVMVSPSSALSFFQSGRLKPIAIGVDQKVANLESVPPISDTVPNFEAIDFYGIVAPKGTPPEVIKTLNEALVKTVGSETVQKNLTAQGNIPFTSTPEYFADFLKHEVKTWGELIEQVGITAG